jgi:hypothetical protein
MEVTYRLAFAPLDKRLQIPAVRLLGRPGASTGFQIKLV